MRALLRFVSYSSGDASKSAASDELSKLATDYPQLKSRLLALAQPPSPSRFLVLRDSIITFSLLLFALLSLFLLSRYPGTLFAPVTAILMLLLLFLRSVDFHARAWDFYLIDFCYLTCLLLIGFLFFFPQSEVVALITYFSNTGIVVWSVYWWNCKFVFHRLDVFTTFWLHYWPALVSYTLRWHPAKIDGADLYFRYPSEATAQFLCRSALLTITWYWAWAAVFYLAQYVLFKSRIDRLDMITSIKFMYKTNKLVSSVMDFVGKEHHEFSGYILYHFVAFLLTGAGAYVCYFSHWANVGLLLALFVLAAWNGVGMTVGAIHHSNGKADKLKY